MYIKYLHVRVHVHLCILFKKYSACIIVFFLFTVVDLEHVPLEGIKTKNFLELHMHKDTSGSSNWSSRFQAFHFNFSPHQLRTLIIVYYIIIILLL